MARLTLANLINEAQDIKQAYPQAKIVRAVNKSLIRVHAENAIPKVSTFTTRPQVTTGTVAVTENSAAVTFSSEVLSTSDPLCLVQIEGNSAWFVLTIVSTTTGTLSSAWPEATDATATFTIVFPTITFPQEVGEIVRIWRDPDMELEFMSDPGRDWDWLGSEVTGTPQRWCPYQHDSSAASPNDELLRILLDPAPEERETWRFAYRARPSLLSEGGATTQTIPLTDQWNEYIVAALVAEMYEVRDGLEKAKAKRDAAEDIYKRIRGARTPAGVIPTKSRAPRRMTAYSPNPYYG